MGSDFVPSIAEWIEQTPGASLLRDNFKANLKALTDETEDDLETLVRMHMIMVRQFIEDKND